MRKTPNINQKENKVHENSDNLLVTLKFFSRKSATVLEVRYMITFATKPRFTVAATRHNETA